MALLMPESAKRSHSDDRIVSPPARGRFGSLAAEYFSTRFHRKHFKAIIYIYLYMML